VLERVMVVIDATGPCAGVTAAALGLAREAGELRAVTVVDVQKCCGGAEEDLEPVERNLEGVVGSLRAAGAACSGQIQRMVNRNVSLGLLRAVAEFRPTLVIIGADNGPSWAPGDRPSRTMLRKAGCPVLVVPEPVGRHRAEHEEARTPA